ncbi:MAG: GlsB/YeaQ/YmgE family stress response membrane protein [Gammaproteobacteria bacterium]|nr:GlsB/YeaQ/YmgE family stress response membrane protein [Gammaproteobacteria bacterium]
MGLIGDVVVGILAGWVTGMVRRGRGYGLVGNLVVGAVGASVGGFLVGIVGFEPDSLLTGVITAVAGAAGLLYLVDRVWQRAFQGAD